MPFDHVSVWRVFPPYQRSQSEPEPMIVISVSRMLAWTFFTAVR